MARSTRRQFLAHAAFAGLGVAGLNGRGGSHIKAFQNMEGVNVTHLIDPDSRLFGGRARGVEKQSGNKPRCVQDVRRALGDDKEFAAAIEWVRDTMKDNSLKLEETTHRVGRTLTFDPATEKV